MFINYMLNNKTIKFSKTIVIDVFQYIDSIMVYLNNIS